MNNMKFLVIGLGSMGKRRVRCLQSLGYSEITGFDLRSDRRTEVVEKYGIKAIDAISNEEIVQYDAIIVSTPPDRHTKYAKMAIDANKPVFIEASVILEEVEKIRDYNKNNSFVAPSCTLRFHPMIKGITEIVKNGKYGKITNFSYHSGQYLPDWHPWENVNDFYVSQRETGGGREIVPFELTWMVDTIGWPIDVKGYFEKTIDLGANIEDSYVLVLKYPHVVGTLIVDVASRYAVRNLVLNLEKAQIQWKWDEEYFKLYEVETNQWIKFQQPQIAAASGYNKNIGEGMYIEEISIFIDGFLGKKEYPNTIEDDIKVLEILNEVEISDGGF